ncbi:PRA1 family protein-domain-containing protein [Aspergillus granulosus]|uniref:PRA1 family protein-domain-containing protein n=1 Tax=Aspergillus granulosus TaxID=176169 RepID=A0ABR4GZP8_9EURO
MSPIQIPIEALTSRFGDRFNSLRSQSLGSRFANLRPVSEFLDFKRISKPANFGEVQSRVNYNLSYFSSNYAAVFVMLSIYSLLTNPVLLFVIIFVSAGLWGIGKLDGRDLELGFARFNTSQLYTGLLLVGVPLGFWASPISTALWLIGATGDRLLVGGDSWRRSMTEHDGDNHALGQLDGTDYDIYEDTNSTVAYAVQLAMKDNEEWLVEKALERIRRAHAEGQKNVTLSKRELEALERKRLQETPTPPVDNKRWSGAPSRSGTAAARTPPYPLDTRSAVSTVSPQISTTTLRAPLQPPFPGSANHAPTFLAPPTARRPCPDDYQRMVPYQVPHSSEAVRSMHSPTDSSRGSPTRLSQASYMDNPPRSSLGSVDAPLSAPDSVVSPNNEAVRGSPNRRTPANSSGDELHIVEVMEHKVPSNPIGAAGKSRQPISRS